MMFPQDFIEFMETLKNLPYKHVSFHILSAMLNTIYSVINRIQSGRKLHLKFSFIALQDIKDLLKKSNHQYTT